MQVEDLIIRLIADWLVIPIVAIGALAVVNLPRESRRKKILMGIFTGVTALVIAKSASLFYQESMRPFEMLGVDPKAAYLNNPGFPSDHALLVFTITFVVWAITKNRALSVTLLILSILVSTGRVIGLVHTPLDVIGSAVIAFLTTWAFFGKNLFKVKE